MAVFIDISDQFEKCMFDILTCYAVWNSHLSGLGLYSVSPCFGLGLDLVSNPQSLGHVLVSGRDLVLVYVVLTTALLAVIGVILQIEVSSFQLSFERLGIKLILIS